MLDLEVLLDEVELLLQSELLGANAIEREAKQIAEPGEHGVGRVRIAMNQRRNRVQRVEEKVRVQLSLQRLQTGFCQARFEMRGRQCTLSGLAAIVHRVTESDEKPVGHHREIEIEEVLSADYHP